MIQLKNRAIEAQALRHNGSPVLFQGSRSGALILWRKQFQSDKRLG